MDASDLPFISIAEAAIRLRDGRTSAGALAEQMLARIETLNPQLNAFITVTADKALDDARRADRELSQGIDRGPLHGIPVALKDMFETNGVRTTAGTAYYADNVPVRDAPAVTRLKEAGCVLLGKTGLHELALGSTSNNPHFGAISNPWQLDFHPGGSSGGSASAVAAGLAFAALGTDTGCSVRQPAQCCGIVGHKPTFGLIGKSGVIPLSFTLDHVGALTRTVRDNAIMLNALAGPDPQDPYSATHEATDFTACLGQTIKGIRLGVPRDFFFEGGDKPVIGLVDDALGILKQLGAVLIDIEIKDVEEAFAAAGALFVEASAAHGDAVRERPEDFSAGLRRFLESGLERPAMRYIEAQRFRAAFRQKMAAIMQDLDALVMPTSTVAAAPIENQPEHHDRERWKNTAIFNFTGQPSISVPCGFTGAELPVGLMITGRMFADAAVLQIAEAYEQTTPWHRRFPDLGPATSPV